MLCGSALLQSNLDKPFYVWGEDALLSWPGAEPALIAERDSFMARVLAATATGHNSNAPAFVAEEVSAVLGAAHATRTPLLATTAEHMQCLAVNAPTAEGENSGNSTPTVATAAVP